MTFAEIGIPGLTAPLQQFVRGNAEVLTVELFFDTSDKGMGGDATSVATETDKIYSLARIDPDGHAPPIVEFHWGSGLSGQQPQRQARHSQKREHFTGHRLERPPDLHPVQRRRHPAPRQALADHHRI